MRARKAGVSGGAPARRDRARDRRLLESADGVGVLARGDGPGYREARLGAGARGVYPRGDRFIPARCEPDGRMMRDMDRDTQIVHAGFRTRADVGPFLQGPQFSSTYTSPGEPSDNELTYGRFHNPTWTAWEEALRVLEGGEAVAFASGMAAVDAVLGITLRPRDVVLLAADCYYTIRRLAAGGVGPPGIEGRVGGTRGHAQGGAREGAQLGWGEKPTQPQPPI